MMTWELILILIPNFSLPRTLWLPQILGRPKNRKPKPVPQPATKPTPKPTPKGKHVQLCKMRRKVGKGFYSMALDAPNSE